MNNNTSPTIEQLRKAVTDAQLALDTWEINPEEHEEEYDDMLNDTYDFTRIGGPFKHMQPSDVLKDRDPTTYRCGLNDYCDGIEPSDDAGYQELEEALEAAEEVLEKAEIASVDQDALDA